MKTRLYLSVAVLFGLLLLGGCGERRILPDSAYEPPKSKQEVQKEAEKEEEEALESVPKVETIGEVRTWTTPDGTSRIEGEMISLKDGYVDILRTTGEVTAIPVERLSEADQKYAKETAAKAAGKEPPAKDEK